MSYLCKMCGLELFENQTICNKVEIRDNEYEYLCPNTFCSEELIHIDTPLTWAIKLLWKKEIDTRYCCSGHILINTIYAPSRKEIEFLLNNWTHRPYIMFEWPKNMKVISTFEELLKKSRFNKYFYLEIIDQSRFTIDTHESVRQNISSKIFDNRYEYIKQANDCIYHFQLLLVEYLNII